MPPTGTPDYLPYAGSFGYRQLAPASSYGTGLGSDVVLQPMAIRGQRDELPVLLSMAVTFRAERLTQPVLAVFSGGALKGHQVIARNPFYSLLPQGAADGSGNLHATWLGKLAEGYQVYYASTLPAVKARLDQTEPGDLAYSAVSVLWGVASGLIFLPFVPLILLAPMGWLALYHLAGSGAGLDQRRGASRHGRRRSALPGRKDGDLRLVLHPAHLRPAAAGTLGTDHHLRRAAAHPRVAPACSWRNTSGGAAPWPSSLPSSSSPCWISP